MTAVIAGFSALLLSFLASGSSLAGDRAPSTYDRMMSDSKLDITIALGFSEKDGHNQPTPSNVPIIGPIINQINAGSEDVGNRNLDVAAVNREVAACKECGFRIVETKPGAQIYRATILRNGRPVVVTLKFIHPDDGVSTDTLKSWFRWGALHDDIVIYAGHSRRGTGFPDFGPSSKHSGKVFENDGGDWPGLNQGFAANLYQILFLNSCKSRQYYRDALRSAKIGKKATDLGLILTNDDAYFEDYPATSMALVRGVMLQEPMTQISEEMEKAAEYFHLNNAATDRQFTAENIPTDVQPQKIADDATRIKPILTSDIAALTPKTPTTPTTDKDTVPAN